jgi:hypothetical protein
VRTALGLIQVARSHAYCRQCRQPEFPADRLLGLCGWLTPRALRMACLAGIHDPFRRAEQMLVELAGWSIDAETIRRHCLAEAQRATTQRPQRVGLAKQFSQSAGDHEVHIDAGKVNTPDGWRDVKVAVFACRQRGPAATAANYEQRDLPAPSVRSVLAGVCEAVGFGQRCQAEAQRLGVATEARLSVLGDGAEWIWNLAGEHFAGATQVLDVYHGVEHLAAAGRAAFGEAQDDLRRWLNEARQLLVGDGYAGVCVALLASMAEEAVRRKLDAEAAAVLNYFSAHQGRLGYAGRLRRGQVIGSGLVEGTIKQRVNLRVKRTGARWQPGHVGPFVEFMAMADSLEWDEHWAAMAT